MRASEILNAVDMMTPRTVPDLFAWVTQKEEDLFATPKAKQYIGSTLKTRFYDEIYPLSLFVKRDYCNNPNAVVTPNLNNDNFDATVTFEGLRSKVFIEITRAKNGHDESLLLELLARDGGVGFYMPITKKSGKRGTPERIIEITPMWQDEHDDERFPKHLSLVETTVKAKAGGRQYGKNFILLVIVDDYGHFRNESDHAKLDVFVRNNLLSSDLDFARLIIFGISGKLQLSYDLPKYNMTTQRSNSVLY